MRRTRKKRSLKGGNHEPTVLIVICSRTPNPLLVGCIDHLKNKQIKDNKNYTICVVDSNSENIEEYNIIYKEFPDVIIEFAKNTNYEYGAWKYAYTKYPKYDIYFCIQDTLIMYKELPINIIDNNNAYIFISKTGFYHHIEIKNQTRKNMKKNGINITNVQDTHFSLARHSSFIVNNHVMKDIVKTFTIAPTNKLGSVTYERKYGLYFIKKNIKAHDMHDYFLKIEGRRT